LGSDFSWRESNNNYRALRIPDLDLLLKPWKGSGAVDGLWNNEGAYSRGGTGMWGMRVYEWWA
jgi:hypothetical protein